MKRPFQDGRRIGALAAVPAALADKRCEPRLERWAGLCTRSDRAAA